MRIGANYTQKNRCEFSVWAPFLEKVELKILSPVEKLRPMSKDELGYWCVSLDNIKEGTRYVYRLNGDIERPDPASHYQPESIHGPSEVVDPDSFLWTDVNWHNLPLSKMIMYEIHTGTFTPEGTFEAIIPKLDHLLELGVNAIELMPITQFPGGRNWGYDGTYPYAVQNTYGGPSGLRRLINECHRKGIAVILDTVYNHLGPEGNYLRDFGPYFTPQYKTPWGDAINFDGEYSDEVRNYFLQNAVYWYKDFHVDALRLDAADRIMDLSAKPFLQELKDISESVSEKIGKKLFLIAETALNDVRLLEHKELHGYGLDAQWLDDFHHCLHTVLTGENSGYYIDYGEVSQLLKTIREGYTYSWQYSKLRKKHYGSSSRDIPSGKFVVFTQNHDHIGNRMLGERLNSLVSFEAMKMTAGIVILSPYIPILFMGEEFGEDNPFLFFVSHTESDLIEAVRKGRAEEFAHFNWDKKPPDPESEDTFNRSKIDWNKLNNPNNRIMLDYYKTLIRLRKEIPALANLDKNKIDVRGTDTDKVIFIHRWYNPSHTVILFNLNNVDKNYTFKFPTGNWEKILDSEDSQYGGDGMSLPETTRGDVNLNLKPWNFAVYKRETDEKKYI